MALNFVSALTHVDVQSGQDLITRYVTHPDVPARESPRPYLHPIRTLQGIEVTGFRPSDHRWHHGLSLAIPVVGETNLWGGRSYDSSAGMYRDKGDNGTIRHQSLAIEAAERRITHHLAWFDAAETLLATEERTLTFATAGSAWTVHWVSSITNRTPAGLRLGSPATQGRTDAGYGGIFFRAADRFRNGSLTRDQLLSSARAVRSSSAETVTLTDSTRQTRVSMTTPSRMSRWFARMDEYPGVGLAPLSTRPHTIAPNAIWEVSCVTTIDDVEKTL